MNAHLHSIIVVTFFYKLPSSFKVATKFRILYFIMLNKKNSERLTVYTRRGLRKFFAASSTTMELLLLKELDFGLQK